MPGAEVIAIVGLISSVIAIFEASKKLYETANNAKGLPRAFQVVSSYVPLVLNILESCKEVQQEADKKLKTTPNSERKRVSGESDAAVTNIMEHCKGNAEALNAIFDKVVSDDQAGAIERYRKAAKAIMPGKKHKVEDLMKEIFEQLQLLQTHHLYESILRENANKITDGIEELSNVPDSLPEENSRYAHTGTGSMNIFSGSGTNYNQSITGGTNSKMYNATTMHFTDAD